MVPRCPEPGLPMLMRLPFMSSHPLMPDFAPAMMWNGSGCTENTALRFLKQVTLSELQL